MTRSVSLKFQQATRNRPRNKVGVASKHGKGAAEWVQSHIWMVLALPNPGNEYRWKDIPERNDTPDPVPQKVMDHRNAFIKNSVVRRERWEETENGIVSIWETNPDISLFAKEIWDQRTEGGTLPKCGHYAGFKTIDPDEGIYECLREDCNETYSRDVIEAVFF